LSNTSIRRGSLDALGERVLLLENSVGEVWVLFEVLLSAPYSGTTWGTYEFQREWSWVFDILNYFNLSQKLQGILIGLGRNDVLQISVF
jgi:hypothetical protein